MVTRSQFRFVTALLVSTGLAAPLAAESSPYAAPAATQANAQSASAGAFERFAPQAERREHRIRYVTLLPKIPLKLAAMLCVSRYVV